MMRANKNARTALRAAAFGVALTSLLPAAAQDRETRRESAYPARPVRLLVGLPAGGTADILARIVTARMSDTLGEQIVVENRPGASGLIAPERAAKATPDGHTLLLRASFFAELVAASGRRMSYDMIRDFTPVSLVWKVPNVLVVNPALPAASVNEFVAHARTRPGELKYGSSGTGTSTHLAMELLKKHAGIDLRHVPYKGAPQSIADLLRGDIQVMFGNVTAQLPHVSQGRLRALAITSPQRSAQLPQVPTMAQAGFPDLEFSVWVGIVAPAGVPRGIVGTLNDAIVRTLRMPDVVKSMAAQGAETAPTTPQEFARFQSAEVAKWTKVIGDAGVKPE